MNGSGAPDSESVRGVSGMMSFTRYALIVFPMFLVAAQWSQGKRIWFIMVTAGLFRLQVFLLLTADELSLGRMARHSAPVRSRSMIETRHQPIIALRTSTIQILPK
jgi:hypothetical protein